MMPVQVLSAEQSSRLRSLVFCYRTIVVALAVLAIAHEAVKLFLVLGAAQFAHVGVEFLAHFIKLATLFFQPVELGLAPIIEGNIARREMRAIAAMRMSAAGEESIGGAVGVALETTQTLPKDDVGEHGETQRP